MPFVAVLSTIRGETVNVFVPYVKAADGDIQYGEIFAAKRTGQFFSELPSC